METNETNAEARAEAEAEAKATADAEETSTMDLDAADKESPEAGADAEAAAEPTSELAAPPNISAPGKRPAPTTWSELQEAGWHWANAPGRDLSCTFWYIRPGYKKTDITGKDSELMKGTHYFGIEQEAIDWARQNGAHG